MGLASQLVTVAVKVTLPPVEGRLLGSRRWPLMFGGVPQPLTMIVSPLALVSLPAPSRAMKAVLYFRSWVVGFSGAAKLPVKRTVTPAIPLLF